MAPRVLVGESQPTSERTQSVPHESQSGQKLLSLVRRWYREPLLHFFLAGALIFAVYQILNPANLTDQSNQIVLTKDDLRQLAVSWLAQGRPSPTADQMRGLVEQRINEEILAREALALGLDKNDEIIKRRLAQKMGFLAQEVAALQNPSDAEFRAWFARNSDRFALSPRATFRHLYFSFDRPRAHDRAAAALGKIAGKPAGVTEVATVADPFMFQDYYAERAPDQVGKVFGPDFARAVFQLKPGGWQGPIRSGYGWHLVFVEAIEPGRVPAFEEVEPDVKSAWLDVKQREVRDAEFKAMRARYTVIVPPIETVDWANLRLSQPPITTEILPQ